MSGRLTGEPVRRVEDHRLLTGRGQFVADIQLPGLLHLAVLRSPYPAAVIREIDATAALAHPGVHGVWCAADISALPGLPVLFVSPGQRGEEYPLLARGRTSYVGEPVAVVVADSRYIAEDALDVMNVEYEALPAVVDALEALAGGTLVHPEWGTNVAFSGTSEWGAIGQTGEAAAVVEAEVRLQRISGAPMETRGTVAHWDAGEQLLTLWSSTQNIHTLREVTAATLGIPESRVRVRCPDVGGGFGVKLAAYPEEILCALASMRLGRPVQFVEDRLEHFVSTVHAREQVHRASAGFAADGRLLWLRDQAVADIGAHIHARGPGPAFATLGAIPGPYHLPAAQIAIQGIVTNKVPNGMYRGVGKTQAACVTETLLEMGAVALGMDAAEMRLRNLITPAEMPCRTPSGRIYDSGDYPACLRMALDRFGYEERRRHQQRLRVSGRHYGIGMACFTDGTGQTSAALMRQGRLHGGYERAIVRLDAGGSCTVLTGLNPGGQGHETVLSQLAADELGLPFGRVRVSHGDTEFAPYSGHGTASSRGASYGGAAVKLACQALLAKALALAAHLLEVSPADLEFRDGAAAIRGLPAQRKTLVELARVARLGHDLPPGMTPGLEGDATFDPEAAPYTFGCCVLGVEVETRTGSLVWDRLVFAHDCGTAINPMIVEGQVVGGIVQGIGNALFEHMRYDRSGQPITTTLRDYLLPGATDVPAIDLVHMATPTELIPGGMRGVGESGAVPVPAAILNAVSDAIGVRVTSLPVTPERLWQLMRAAPGGNNEREGVGTDA